jgi:hypothetical protein
MSSLCAQCFGWHVFGLGWSEECADIGHGWGGTGVPKSKNKGMVVRKCEFFLFFSTGHCRRFDHLSFSISILSNITVASSVAGDHWTRPAQFFLWSSIWYVSLYNLDNCCHYHLPCKNWNLYLENKCLWKFSSEISTILYDYYIDVNFIIFSTEGKFVRGE